MKLNSHIYHKRIKALTETVKGLYPLLRHVPAPLPRPGTPGNVISPKLSAKEVNGRKEAWSALDMQRLDQGTVSYWLQEAADEPRRN